MTVVSTRALPYIVIAKPIIKAEKNIDFGLRRKFLYENKNSGSKIMIGQALIITTLHALDIPTFSIILSGNQYIPHAEALAKVAKLKLVSEYIFFCIGCVFFERIHFY